MGRDETHFTGLLGIGSECCEQRGSALSEKEKEVVLVQEYMWGEAGCQPNSLGSNPSCTIYYSIPCASHSHSLGISFFSV